MPWRCSACLGQRLEPRSLPLGGLSPDSFDHGDASAHSVSLLAHPALGRRWPCLEARFTMRRGVGVRLTKGKEPMCRLYALRANEPTRVECSLVRAQNALMAQSRGDREGLIHGDGWGVA